MGYWGGERVARQLELAQQPHSLATAAWSVKESNGDCRHQLHQDTNNKIAAVATASISCTTSDQQTHIFVGLRQGEQWLEGRLRRVEPLIAHSLTQRQASLVESVTMAFTAARVRGGEHMWITDEVYGANNTRKA